MGCGNVTASTASPRVCGKVTGRTASSQRPTKQRSVASPISHFAVQLLSKVVPSQQIGEYTMGQTQGADKGASSWHSPVEPNEYPSTHCVHSLVGFGAPQKALVQNAVVIPSPQRHWLQLSGL